MVSLERILLFVMLTVILVSLFVPTLDSAITESSKNENLQESKTQYEALAHPGVSDVRPSFSESSTPPIVQWNGTYGGTDYEYAYALVQTADGGYALAGYSNTLAWLVKTDACGNLKWDKTFGGKWTDYIFSMVQTDDGGYAMAGSTNSYTNYKDDSWLIKTDALGNLQWNKTYGGVDTHERAYSMVQTSDGGFVLAGTSYLGVGDHDIYLVKTYPSGEMQWNKTYPGVDDNHAYSVVQTSDGGYALTGYSWSHSLSKPVVFLVKTDSVGEISWSSWYYDVAGRCQANSLVQADDGGFAIAGLNYTGYYMYALLIKTDSFGNVTWSKNCGLSNGAQMVVQTTDGGYALAGYIRSTHGGVTQSDLYMVKTNPNGDIQWNITYGGTDDDVAHALVQTVDGGYATAGCTTFGAGGDDFWLVKFSAPDDLYVASVEPIQVVLDAKALVANKSTAIRATVSSTFSTRVWVEINVTYDFGRESYLEEGPDHLGIPIDPGLNRVYIPGGPVKPTASPDPWIPSGQPPWLNWTRTGFDSNIRAIVDPLDKIPETDETNNERTCGMKVVASSRLRILVVPVYFPMEGEDERSFSMLVLDKWLGAEMLFLNSTFPIAEDQFDWHLNPPEPCYEFQEAFDPIPRRVWLNWILGRKYTVMAQNSDFDRAVIVVRDLGGVSGVTFYGGVIPAVFVNYLDLGGGMSNPRELTADLIAHEIGHTYYLQHPHDEGPAIYDAQRFWVVRRLYEDSAYTYMGYTNRLPPGLPSDSAWIDKGRYDSNPKQRTLYYLSLGWRWNLFDQLTIPDPEVIVLRAVMFENGTAKADEPWYRLPKGVPNLFLEDTGNYSIVLLDSERQVLGTLGFNASFSYLSEINETWIETQTDKIPFDFTIPYLAGTSFIEIRNATDHLLLSRAVSPNAPTVSITFPNGGEVLTAGMNCTINWESSDTDEDQLTYFVAYSLDGGDTWIPLTLDIAENNYVWNTNYMIAGTNYLVKVIATDGVNTGEDISNGTFTLVDLTPPSIDVISPQNKTYFNSLVPLTFETDELTSWIGYSIDNEANVTLDGNTIINVEDGIHQIVLYANDTSGNMGSSQTVYFTVNTLTGDLNNDGFVDIFDITTVALAFNSKPGDQNWNPIADINNDNIVDIFDIVVVALHFGETG